MNFPKYTLRVFITIYKIAKIDTSILRNSMEVYNIALANDA